MAKADQKKPNRRGSPSRKIAAWLVVFNYAQAGIGFLVNLWLARELGSDEYGLLSYGLVVGGICTILVGFSSERTLVRDLIQGSDRHAMLTASIVLRAAMACLVVGGCGVWAITSESLGSKADLVILCSLWGASMALTPRAWLDCHYRMHIHAAITFFEKCAYAVCVVLLVSYGFQSDHAIVAASCLLFARCLGLAWEWFYVARTFKPKSQGIFKNIRFLIQQNSFILGAAVGNLLMTHANQILLEHERGSSQLAYYSIAIQIIMMMQIFQSQMVRLLAPHIAELTRPGASVRLMRSSLGRYVVYMLAVSAALILPIVVLAPWAIQLTLSEDYLAAVPVLRILCCWSLIYGPALAINQFLLGLRLQKYFFVITMLAGGSAIILGQKLVPIYGMNGVASVLLVTHSFSISAQLILVWLESRRLESSEIKENDQGDSSL